MARVDKFTQTRKQDEFYSDFVNNFDLNIFTGSVGKVINDRSIRQGLRNLLLTNTGERLFNPTFGSDIRKLLFENYTPFVEDELIRVIKFAVQQYEPRVNLIDVLLKEIPENNEIDIELQYSIINTTNIQVLNLIVQRVR